MLNLFKSVGNLRVDLFISFKFIEIVSYGSFKAYVVKRRAHYSILCN